MSYQHQQLPHCHIKSVGRTSSHCKLSSSGDVLFRGPIEPKHADEATAGCHGSSTIFAITTGWEPPFIRWIRADATRVCTHAPTDTQRVSAQPTVANLEQQPAVPSQQLRQMLFRQTETTRIACGSESWFKFKLLQVHSFRSSVKFAATVSQFRSTLSLLT